MHKGLLQPAELPAIARMVRADVENGILEDCPLEAWRWIDVAHQVPRQVTSQTGTRALAILHIAQARMRGATVFLTFDRNQRAAASHAGLTVAP